MHKLIVLLGLVAWIGSVAGASAEPAQQAGPTPVQCVTPPVGIQLALQNPNPGDTLQTGTQVVMTGIAYDTRATSGVGVASVTVSLGDRDAGGISLGSAQLGQPNPTVAPGTQFATAGFRLQTPRLPSGSGAKTIFVYAKSSISDAEAVLQVPIYLNTVPTPVRGQVPTPIVATAPNCTPTPIPTSAPISAPAPAAAVAATPTPTRGVPTPTPFSPPGLVPAPAPAAQAAPTVAPQPLRQPTPAAVAGAGATAPRGGGIPAEVGVALMVAGAFIVGGGYALRRRERHDSGDQNDRS